MRSATETRWPSSTLPASDAKAPFGIRIATGGMCSKASGIESKRTFIVRTVRVVRDVRIRTILVRHVYRDPGRRRVDRLANERRRARGHERIEFEKRRRAFDPGAAPHREWLCEPVSARPVGLHLEADQIGARAVLADR